MPEPAALLAHTAAAWGWELSTIQIDQFAAYAAELQHWNAHINLTAVADLPGIYRRHFLDSLACARFWGDEPRSLVDIGSGAGFPGLPLKLLCPALQLTLIESVGKKAAFLRHLVATLALPAVEVLQVRAEAAGRDPQQRERYDVATGRAVADLRVLAEYALPLLRAGGRLLAPKGADSAREVDAARPALDLLGGRLLAVEPVELPDDEPPRTLVVVAKARTTPATYPRAVGVPARRPLR